MNPLRSVGLTGGIGSGKSTVARLLAEAGALVVDTDAIARQLTQPGGAAMPALRATFGAAALRADGALDRDRMRVLAFSDPGAKARLEAILHPMIGSETQRQAAAHGGRPVVFDVPLLAEGQRVGAWRARVDRILVIDCPAEIQVARVAQRPGWDASSAQRVIDQQATRAQRRAIADAVIFNGTNPLESLAAEVRALWALWMGTPAAH